MRSHIIWHENGKNLDDLHYKKIRPRTGDNLRRNTKKVERGILNIFSILENKEKLIPMGV